MHRKFLTYFRASRGSGLAEEQQTKTANINSANIWCINVMYVALAVLSFALLQFQPVRYPVTQCKHNRMLNE